MKAMPPIYCVSLARAKDRRAAMHESLSALGVPFEIVDAVDGRDLDLSGLGGMLRQDLARRRYGRNLSRGEIGCYLSHYNLWQRMADENTPAAVIVEDDVEFFADFKKVLAGVLDKSDAADVVLFHLPSECYGGDVVWKIDETYKVVRAKMRVAQCAAYLINLAGAKKLVKYAAPIRATVDFIYSEYWRNGLAYYAVEPRVAAQKGMPRTITTGDVNTRAFKILSFNSDATLWERVCASFFRKRDKRAVKRYNRQNPAPKI